MRQLAVAIGLICQDGMYLLQQRGSDPKIGAAGLIGAFGGKLEEGESPAETVCRELSEETSFTPPVDALEYVGDIDVISDHQLEEVKVHVAVFCISLPPEVEIFAKEGRLVKITKEEATRKISQLTPATRACFEQLI